MEIQEAINKCADIIREPHNVNIEKYANCDSVQLINDMQQLGWNLFDIKSIKHQARPHNGKLGRKDLHVMRFKNENISFVDKNGSVNYPEILVHNSHDGLSSFKFRIGIYRVVCSNGLILGTNYGSAEIRHKNYDFSHVTDAVQQLICSINKLFPIIRKMEEIEVTKEMKREMAIQALLARFDVKSLNEVCSLDNQEVLIQNATKINRIEDLQNQSLWTIFNIIQENIISKMKGVKYGTYIRKSKKNDKTSEMPKKYKRLTNLQRVISVNEAMFDTAVSYINE